MGDPLPLLKELVKIDSSTKTGVNKAVDYCETWLKERGLHVERLENHGYHMLVSDIGKGDDTIVLNGHIDVIEAKDAQFTPAIKDGKVYGRGSADMKAGLAAMMETMADLKRSDVSRHIQLQVVPDEESGGTYGTKYLTEQGYLGDFIICGEPTGLAIAIQSKGVLQLDFTVYGEPAHGSRPWEGHNAITKAYKLFEDILELSFAKETDPPMFKEPSVNLAKIKGGTVYNKVPDQCEMSLDIRYLPEQDPDEILEQIQEITEDDAEIHVHDRKRPVRTAKNNPWVQELVDSVTNQTQREKADLKGQHGSSDGQYFIEYGGGAVEFGPLGYDWHGDKELVYTNSVREYQKVLIDFLSD